MADVLTLRVTEYVSPTEWRWELTGLGDEFISDHEVRLDATSQGYKTFCDLYGHLRLTADPRRRPAQESEILLRCGRWIGDTVFGPGIGSALLFYAPCTVHIRIPGEARALAGYPLESAVFGDATLQATGISLVLDVEDRAGSSFRAPSKEPVRDRLRILGLFTVPEGSSPLNLRRERTDLDRQVRLRAAQGEAVDLQILQYGVTRERLKDVIAEAEGWDLIHISGHGARGALLLERSDGSHDLVTDDELIDILKPASRRLKLVTVSACHSAARVALDNLDLLGLKPAVRADDTVRSGTSESMLALNLAQRLRCAVVGMRFPVTDGFATEFTQRLYHYLVGKRHALPHALSLAVKDSSAGDATPDRPALSRGTPAVFGSAALDLTISAPRGPLRGFQESKKKAYLGEPSPRFVGRVGVMARASATLAPESGKPGVLFHGMAGAGKTSCARELAHLLSEGFQEIVWYGAPPDGSDIGASLGDLAKALATQLPRIPDLDPLLGDATALERFLPTLTAFLRHERVLIVLDNVETLLTSQGNWRDPRWGQVVEAMTAHTGLSKVLITTRTPPGGSHGSLHIEAVHSLSLSESVLLARELPNLRTLIDGGHEDVPDDAGRELAIQILHLAQGHPKLLELADGQAASRDHLEQLLQYAHVKWTERGGIPEGFFSTGESSVDATDYADVLAAWTINVLRHLPNRTGMLFTVLACLHDRDRFLIVASEIAEQVMTDDGLLAEAFQESIDLLQAGALVSLTDTSSGALCRIHPHIAETGRRLAGDELARLVDKAAGAFWRATLSKYLGPDNNSASSEAILFAAESGIPYLMREGEWRATLPFLESVLERDPTRSAADRLLPVLRKVADEAAGQIEHQSAERLLALALTRIDPAAAEQHLRSLYAEASSNNDHRQASLLADELITLLIAQGARLSEALKLCEKMLEHSAKAGFGPWTRVADECTQIEILGKINSDHLMLDMIDRLRQRTSQLRVDQLENEFASPWHVQERLLKVGFNAANGAHQWVRAHDFNADLIRAMEARKASEQELAYAQLPDYGPLMNMGRHDEARELIAKCQDIFEKTNDMHMIGRCRIALAQLDSADLGQAIGQHQDRFQLAYESQDIVAISITHNDVATSLIKGQNSPEALPHALAAALIDNLTESRRQRRSIRKLAICLIQDDLALPEDYTALCDALDELPGVRFRDLITTHGRTWEDIDDRYFRVLLAGKNECAHIFFNVHPDLAFWRPLLAGIFLGFSGSSAISQEVTEILNTYSEVPDWTALAPIMLAALEGRYRIDKVGSLHPVQAAIAARAFDRRHWADPTYIEAAQHLWGARRLAPLFRAVVAGARGDQEIAEQAADNLERLHQPDTVMLVNGLRRILDRDFENALTGRDEGTDFLLRAVLEHATAPTPQELLTDLEEPPTPPPEDV